MTDAVALARRTLDRFEQAVAAADVEALLAACTDDVVLFGTARANVGPDETRAYLRQVVEANVAIRWSLDRVVAVHADDDLVVVAGHGEVELDEGDGPQRSAFRLSLALRRSGEDWLVSHFHGSVPEV